MLFEKKHKLTLNIQKGDFRTPSKVLHSFFYINEAEKVFNNHDLEVVFKENRIRTRTDESEGEVTLGFCKK